MKPTPFPRAAHLGKPASRKEDVEQREVCTFLDKLGVLYCAIPNGGKRGKIEAARMKGLGTKRGAPDLVIFHRPPNAEKFQALVYDRGLGELKMEKDRAVLDWFWPGVTPVGVAVEMKRTDATRSAISEDQRKWAVRLQREGWYWFAARGADEAIAELMRLGFGS